MRMLKKFGYEIMSYFEIMVEYFNVDVIEMMIWSQNN